MRRPTIAACLEPLCPPEATLTVATGFHYDAEEKKLHGVDSHQAIDLAVHKGQPIGAPASGWYVTTYGEYPLTRGHTPRMLSLSQALTVNRQESLNPPEDGDGPWPIWFGSYVIQGWLEDYGIYIQIAHVEYVVPKVPFYRPTYDQGSWVHSPVLRWPTNRYNDLTAAHVSRGEVIGYTGATGIGWGRPCINDALVPSRDERLDFRGQPYSHWDQPHIHLAVFGPRDRQGKPTFFLDPFGAYGDRNDPRYHLPRSQWHTLPNSLWLPQR